MKTIKLYRILSFILIAFTLQFCVKDNDFSVPEINETEPDITADATIIKIKNDFIQNYNTNGRLVYSFRENDVPTCVSGYVVSNDAAGNFYKKLIVQDAIENPTFGIEIHINNGSLSETYDVGRKIYIKLDGLSVSYDDGQSASNINPTNNIPGKYVLGLIDHTGMVTDIPSTAFRNYLVRTTTLETIIPTKIRIGSTKEKHINTLIKIESAQFEKNQLGKTFAGEANDQFDGFRTLFDCASQTTILLQTSTFASFKSNKIPAGKGETQLVLSKDYRAEFFVVIANTPSDFNFSNTERCDPPSLDCGEDTIATQTIIFQENFDALSSTNSLTAAGWTNLNVNNGNTIFILKNSSGNKYMEAAAYNTDENPLEIWLVTPAINLENTTDAKLTFGTKTGFNNGTALSVLVSSDFTGNPNEANWLRIDNAVLADGPASGNQSNFTNSGNINLSCLSGTIYIAFKYLGGDGGISTTFHIDNVSVTGN